MLNTHKSNNFYCLQRSRLRAVALNTAQNLHYALWQLLLAFVSGWCGKLKKMNLVDVFIVEIIEEPKQVVTDDFCGWVVKVMTDCYGCKKEKTFTGVTKKEIEKYKVGYSWME